MLPWELYRDLGKHKIQAPLREREKDSRKFLKALTEWVGWLDLASKATEYHHTLEYLDGFLGFRIF